MGTTRQPGLLHPSDRGSPYASGAYQHQLQAAQMGYSMSRKGNCDDNAVVERVFRSLKGDGLPEPPRQASLLVLDYLEMFYSSQRLHSTLDYQSPNAFEAQAAGVNQGVLKYGPRGDRSMAGKYGSCISRDSRKLAWATAQNTYSHNSLFPLSIFIGPLHCVPLL